MERLSEETGWRDIIALQQSQGSNNYLDAVLADGTDWNADDGKLLHPVCATGRPPDSGADLDEGEEVSSHYVERLIKQCVASRIVRNTPSCHKIFRSIKKNKKKNCS